MSTDFEDAVIAYGESFDLAYDRREREKRKRELLHIIDAEYGEDGEYSIALKAIVEKADVGADGQELGRRSEG